MKTNQIWIPLFSISLFTTLTTPSTVWALPEFTPPSFTTKAGKAVFVDFTKAHYEITFDYREKQATVVSTIDFDAAEDGHPVFDLLPQPLSVSLDGVETSQELIATPGNETTLRMLERSVKPGSHQMVIVSHLNHKVTYGWSGVTSFFSIRDLSEKKFVEQYIPANLEYDQVPMIFDVRFKNMRSPKQEFLTNGITTQVTADRTLIEFPEYFNCSSLFFQTAPRGKLKKRAFTYHSVSGADIPVTIYKKFFIYNLKKFKKKTLAVLAELENDYGAFPHPSLSIFTKGLRGGMEHSGGTETSYVSLGHELFHSYFAKGIMPANGDAGWIDEAFASWRDRGYPRLTDPGFDVSNMGRKSPYVRATDTRAYSQGMRFMAYMDHKLANAGGLKSFMREFLSNKVHQLITTETLQKALEDYSGLDLQKDFDRYILGVHGPGAPDPKKASTNSHDEDHEENLAHEMHGFVN